MRLRIGGIDAQRFLVVGDGLRQTAGQPGECQAKVVVPTRSIAMPGQGVFPNAQFAAIIVISLDRQRPESGRDEAEDEKSPAPPQGVTPHRHEHDHRCQGQIHPAFRHRLLRNRHHR